MKNILTFLLIIVFSQHSFSQTNDSSAIVRVLENESATWRSGDSTAHAACWQIEPYSSVIIITAGGKIFSLTADKIIHPAPGTMGKGGTSKNTSYRMSIHGNSALVTHNETSIDISGRVSNTYEVRMLEKINDSWKLTGQIIQVL